MLLSVVNDFLCHKEARNTKISCRRKLRNKNDSDVFNEMFLKNGTINKMYQLSSLVWADVPGHQALPT